MKVVKEEKKKYENCLTLSKIKKYSNGCLKKTLHVPTLTMHYMRECKIG